MKSPPAPSAGTLAVMLKQTLSKSKFIHSDIMKTFIKSVTHYRIIGIILFVCSLLGYIFVADELHHFGEFLGVTCILLAGLIFFVIDTKFNIFKGLAIQWIALGLLISIPIGGVVLDNMPLGITICFLIGFVLAYVFRKRVINTNR